mmetsp:Transcript_7142/g.14650  ORF Transcript_7142/g.14650 Transcript_7142/m.14650 type:complete len:305 (+) Transcript_7142:347-1261(+)|eukprot:CAMPEP_0168738702 /NCGR_PEP_ID=MMETSP0724-20121128/11073_1 /TAXON_ID=265536 /ORGANISM="Amphiprora sp., Strain CCMP467" /LENGTH=304 /DNA_ID=CAMNT_0008786061 /DNA_START=299 /DNA_END=1213 /DNA_ORIENTATION=-
MAPRTKKTPPTKGKPAKAKKAPAKKKRRGPAAESVIRMETPNTARQRRALARNARKKQGTSSYEPQHQGRRQVLSILQPVALHDDDDERQPFGATPSSPMKFLFSNGSIAPSNGLGSNSQENLSPRTITAEIKVAQMEQRLESMETENTRLKEALAAVQDTGTAMSAYYFRLARYGPTKLTDEDYERARQEVVGNDGRGSSSNTSCATFDDASWWEDLQNLHGGSHDTQLWLNGFYSAGVASARLFSRLAATAQEDEATTTYADKLVVRTAYRERQEALSEYPVFVPLDGGSHNDDNVVVEMED